MNLESFLALMKSIQDDRSEAIGGHSYKKLIEKYGPAIMFAELASIVSRLEFMLWNKTDEDGNLIDHERLQDLCVDLANYSSFLWGWSVDRQNPSEITIRGQAEAEMNKAND